MIQQKELLLTQLRKNLSDYEEVDFTQEQQNFLIELFSQMIDKKQKGEQQKKLIMFARSQIQKRQNSEKLEKGFLYLLERAKGKYGFWGNFFILLGNLLNYFDKDEDVE